MAVFLLLPSTQVVNSFFPCILLTVQALVNSVALYLLVTQEALHRAFSQLAGVLLYPIISVKPHGLDVEGIFSENIKGKSSHGLRYGKSCIEVSLKWRTNQRGIRWCDC